MAARRKLLVVNHFELATICGTTVLFAELLRLTPHAAPGLALAYESYEPYASPAALRARLEAAHADAACVVVANAHIEVSWELSEAVFRWSRDRGIPAYVYAFDYWPHHEDNLRTLTTRLDAKILASTPFLADSLARAGFASELLEIGVPLPATTVPAAPPPPALIASAGRLVPRKRLADIVDGFARSGLDGEARLYLRVLPSNVFGAGADDEQLREIEHAIAHARLTGVVVDRASGAPPDYPSYAVYVCASSYEGFSMPVIEAAFHGCPPLMSDIPPHQRTARALFGDRAGDFLFPVGDTQALGDRLRDEVTTGARRAWLDARIEDVRATITARWSLARTARGLERLAHAVSA